MNKLSCHQILVQNELSEIQNELSFHSIQNLEKATKWNDQVHQ